MGIIKYEPELRNKAILTLFWDLDARNHEITALRIRDIRFQERYAEGEIPYNTKTGGGPILLTCSLVGIADVHQSNVKTVLHPRIVRIAVI
jgi:hypothetical protein